ncbi:MAG: dTMP kinase [Betaproteobacteria bacterium]|nr:MAG: dTMP kinase [Betaproteobacteria bacterium]
MRGKFVTLEGVDGAGKSTHLDWIARRLQAAGKKVQVTREPGGTPLGEELRKLLLARSMHLETEALLMFAARREHLDKLILPALAAGSWVVSDRFTDATFAYQGGGRGLDLGRIETLEQWVHQGLQPDLTLVFDLSVEEGKRRRVAATSQPDRFEREDLDFFARVRAVYLARAERYPQRIRLIDASRTVEDIRKSLEDTILTLCQ